MESLFAFLFKYRPIAYQKGDLAFDPPSVAVLAGAVLLAAVAFAAYRRRDPRVAPADRAVLAALRGTALVLLGFCLLRPVLVVATSVPRQNFLAVLVDDSRSMGIADQDGRPRAAPALEALAPGAPLREALAGRFQLRFYGFSAQARRIAEPESLDFAGARTDLGRALRYVRQDLTGVPVAGVVVLTDGAQNADGAWTDPVLEYQAAGIPVYPVGLGRERPAQDIELGRVDVPGTVLEGASVVVDVPVTQWGYGGRTVQLDVEENGRIVARREVRLPADGVGASARVHLTATTPGAHLYRFNVPLQPGETIAGNNAREALVVVEDRREKILHVEGEPRFETKFLRRAVEGDSNLQVVTLQRTAEGKFLRLGVDSAGELAAGFPRTREELFRYRGLVLGSVEAGFFTHDQLRMIEDFVSERGGGLLVLGGRLALAEGGYPGTPVAGLLPVELEARSQGDTAIHFQEVRLDPTPVGQGHPALQVSADPDSSVARWGRLPRLSIVNPVRRAKPGASVLLGAVGEDGTRFVGLAHHRYGRGKVIAFPVQDAWVWQMHAAMPLEDQTHETLWRQLLRWLVSYVPEPVAVAASPDAVEPGQTVRISASVRDSAYLGLNGAAVRAVIEGPSGRRDTVGLAWAVEKDGEYEGEFAPVEPGQYRVTVEAADDGRGLGAASAHFRVAALATEYFGAGMRAAQLRALAEETGGRFYTAAGLARLADDVDYSESGAVVRERHDLWDLPVVFLLLVGVLGGEWVFRRRRGLA